MYLYPTIAELASYLDTLPKADVQVEEKVVDVVYKGHSSTAPDAVFYQAMVVVGSLLLDQAPSIVTHAAIYVTWRQFNACVAAQVGVFVSLVCSCVLVLVAVVANRCLAPVSHGDIVRIPLFSLMARWLAAQHAARAAQAVAAYGAGTPLLAAFYGVRGAAVGDDVVLDAGVTVDDPQFVTLDTKVRCRRHTRRSARTSSSGASSCWRPSSWSGAPSWAYGPASAPAASSKRITPSTRSRTSRAARRAPTATSLF